MHTKVYLLHEVYDDAACSSQLEGLDKSWSRPDRFFIAVQWCSDHDRHSAGTAAAGYWLGKQIRQYKRFRLSQKVTTRSPDLRCYGMQ